MTPLPGIDPTRRISPPGASARYGQNGAETFALARVESDANNPRCFASRRRRLTRPQLAWVLEAILSQIVP